MLNLNPTYRCEIKPVKEWSFVIKIFDNENYQIGASVYCIKLGYIKDTIKKLQYMYNLHDSDIIYKKNNKKGEMHVR